MKRKLSVTEIPYPFDHYHPWQPAANVDDFQVSLILAGYPPGTEMVEASPYRPGYMHYPFRIRVQLPDGGEACCVLKADPLIGGIEREGMLLPVLTRLGLPAPSVLAGPSMHPDYPNGGALIVLSEMPGKPFMNHWAITINKVCLQTIDLSAPNNSNCLGLEIHISVARDV